MSFTPWVQHAAGACIYSWCCTFTQQHILVSACKAELCNACWNLCPPGEKKYFRPMVLWGDVGLQQRECLPSHTKRKTWKTQTSGGRDACTAVLILWVVQIKAATICGLSDAMRDVQTVRLSSWPCSYSLLFQGWGGGSCLCSRRVAHGPRVPCLKVF